MKTIAQISFISILLTSAFCFASNTNYYRCEINFSDSYYGGFEKKYEKVIVRAGAEYISQAYRSGLTATLTYKYDGKRLTASFQEDAGPYGGRGDVLINGNNLKFTGKVFSGSANCAEEALYYAIFLNRDGNGYNLDYNYEIDENIFVRSDDIVGPYAKSACYFGNAQSLTSELLRAKNKIDSDYTTIEILNITLQNDVITIQSKESHCTKEKQVYIESYECVEKSPLTARTYNIPKCPSN